MHSVKNPEKENDQRKRAIRTGAKCHPKPVQLNCPALSFLTAFIVFISFFPQMIFEFPVKYLVQVMTLALA